MTQQASGRLAPDLVGAPTNERWKESPENNHEMDDGGGLWRDLASRRRAAGS